LAKLILRNTSFELRHGRVRALAFLVDMNQVFEDFVVVALREALKLSESTFPQGAKRRPLRLDQAGAVRLHPDLSWWDGSICTFVGDAKYRQVSAAGIEHPDLYQLLAYVIGTDLPGGMLVYAAGEAQPVTHRVVRLGKELHVEALDLQGSPDEILGQVRGVAERIRGLRRLALTGRIAA
jgi:5-methylcytosine-specific restriction enzyme subunit McrC